MKILVIGSTGVVGSAFRRNQDANDTYFFENHEMLEITDKDQVAARLKAKKPDVVINTAAYVGVDPCALNPEQAFLVNAVAVKNLAEICSLLDICLVQISSDAVFDGKKGALYTEEDQPNPINMYGMTKYIGELFAKNVCQKYYVFRLPILFGLRENKGSIFIEKMHRLALSGKTPLRISADVISCPSYSDDIAREILRLLKMELAYGVYHLKNEGQASLYDFAKEFFDQLGLKVNLERAKAADFAAGEKDCKPLNTAIKSVKIKHLRSWQEAMGDFIPQFKQKEGLS